MQVLLSTLLLKAIKNKTLELSQGKKPLTSGLNWFFFYYQLTMYREVKYS